MKHTITAVLGLLVSLHLMVPSAQSQGIDWMCDYDEAKQEAYLKGEFMLLTFVAEWDPARATTDDPRTRMEEEAWKDTTLIRLTGQYVCVRMRCARGHFGP